MKRRWSSKLVIVKNATQGLFVAEAPEMHDLRQRRCLINRHLPNLRRQPHEIASIAGTGSTTRFLLHLPAASSRTARRTVASFGNLIIFYREALDPTLRADFFGDRPHQGRSSRHFAAVRFWIMVRTVTRRRRKAWRVLDRTTERQACAQPTLQTPFHSTAN